MSHNPCISLGFSSPLYTTNKLRRVLITAQVILQRGEPSPAGWGSSGGYAPPPSKQRFPTLPSIHTSWPRLLVEWWLLGGESSVLEVGPRRKKKTLEKTSLKMMTDPLFYRVISKNYIGISMKMSFLWLRHQVSNFKTWCFIVFCPAEFWVNEFLFSDFDLMTKKKKMLTMM